MERLKKQYGLDHHADDHEKSVRLNHLNESKKVEDQKKLHNDHKPAGKPETFNSIKKEESQPSLGGKLPAKKDKDEELFLHDDKKSAGNKVDPLKASQTKPAELKLPGKDTGANNKPVLAPVVKDNSKPANKDPFGLDGKGDDDIFGNVKKQPSKPSLAKVGDTKPIVANDKNAPVQPKPQATIARPKDSDPFGNDKKKVADDHDVWGDPKKPTANVAKPAGTDQAAKPVDKNKPVLAPVVKDNSKPANKDPFGLDGKGDDDIFGDTKKPATKPGVADNKPKPVVEEKKPAPRNDDFDLDDF